MQYYGYLNQDIIDSYQSKLSNEGKLLLNDIKKTYELNILPHKREPFEDSNLNNVSPDTSLRTFVHKIYSKMNVLNLARLIRPDVENSS